MATQEQQAAVHLATLRSAVGILWRNGEPCAHAFREYIEACARYEAKGYTGLSLKRGKFTELDDLYRWFVDPTWE